MSRSSQNGDRCFFESRTYVHVLVAVILLLLLVGGVVYLDHRCFYSKRVRALRCNNIIRQIDAAKEQYRVEHVLADGDFVSPEQLGPYLDGGWKGNTCPAGGMYQVNPVGQNPRCSVHGALPEAKGSALKR